MSHDKSQDNVIEEDLDGGKILHASIHRDTPQAVAKVLEMLAERVKDIESFELYEGRLDHPLSDDDVRAQISIEFTVTNEGAGLRTVQTTNHKTGSDNAKPVIVSDTVSRMSIALPAEDNQPDISALLRAASDELLSKDPLKIHDLSIHNYIDSDGIECPEVVVYYSK